jgi:exosome complex exonuclease RRP6
VDPFPLWFDMHRLGAVFANPAVVKVLHGCDRDILWMQRDFGLYVLNCFDTHRAAKALNYPAVSLAHLLKVHCNITADKKHQLSDWRVRPLTLEMEHYANEDTKYLLYIYDRLRQQLWKSQGAAGLEHVFAASRQLCLARYEKEVFDSAGYQLLFAEKSGLSSKSSSSKDGSTTGGGGGGGGAGRGKAKGTPALEDLSSLQHAALQGLWDWRDQAARDKDESSAVIMSNAELVRIGVNLPLNAVQLEQQCGPLSSYTREAAARVMEIVAAATSVGPMGLAASAAAVGGTSSGSSKSSSSGAGAAKKAKTAFTEESLRSPLSAKAVRQQQDAQAKAAAAGAGAAESTKPVGPGVASNTVYTFTPTVLDPTAAAAAAVAAGAQVPGLSSPVPGTMEVRLFLCCCCCCCGCCF